MKVFPGNRKNYERLLDEIKDLDRDFTGKIIKKKIYLARHQHIHKRLVGVLNIELGKLNEVKEGLMDELTQQYVRMAEKEKQTERLTLCIQKLEHKINKLKTIKYGVTPVNLVRPALTHTLVKDNYQPLGVLFIVAFSLLLITTSLGYTIPLNDGQSQDAVTGRVIDTPSPAAKIVRDFMVNTLPEGASKQVIVEGFTQIKPIQGTAMLDGTAFNVKILSPLPIPIEVSELVIRNAETGVECLDIRVNGQELTKPVRVSDNDDHFTVRAESCDISTKDGVGIVIEYRMRIRYLSFIGSIQSSHISVGTIKLIA